MSSHIASSSRLAAMSLMIVAPASTAARATTGFCVSMERGILVWPTSSLMTGITLSNSTDSSTFSAPGREDSPPISRISAPSAARRNACSTARSTDANFPPSENESGVTFTTPITIVGRGNSQLQSHALNCMPQYATAPPASRRNSLETKNRPPVGCGSRLPWLAVVNGD